MRFLDVVGPDPPLLRPNVVHIRTVAEAPPGGGGAAAAAVAAAAPPSMRVGELLARLEAAGVSAKPRVTVCKPGARGAARFPLASVR